MDRGQGGSSLKGKTNFLHVNIITYAKLGKGRVKNIARSRKAALRNLTGFGGVKLFVLKYVTITTVTTAIVTNVTHTTVTITIVTFSTNTTVTVTTVTITTVTTVTITTVTSTTVTEGPTNN